MNAAARWENVARGLWSAVAFCFPLVLVLLPKATVLLLALVAVCGMVFLLVRRVPCHWPLSRSVVLLVVCFLVWGMLSAAWEETSGLALHKAVQLTLLCAGGFVALAFARVTPAPEGRGWGALTAGVFVALGFIVFERLSGCLLGGWIDILRGQDTAICVLPRYKSAVTILAIILPMLTLALCSRRTIRACGIAATLFLLVVGCAVLTSSYSAVTALVAGVLAFVLVILWPRVGTWVVAVTLATPILLAPVIASKLPTPFEAYEISDRIPSSFTHRLLIWHFVTDHIVERPVLGWGLDAARELPGGDGMGTIKFRVGDNHPPLLLQQQLLPLHPHNLGLQVWLETGGIGALVFSGVLVLAVLASVRGGSRVSKAVQVATFAAIVAVALSAYGAWQSWWLSSLWLIVAFAMRMKRQDRS